MHVTLFKALKSVKIDDDQATAVVDRLDEHVESVVNNNIIRVQGDIARLEGRLAAFEGKVDGKFGGIQAALEAMKTQNVFIGILLSIVGLAIAVAPIIGKLVY